MDNSKQSKQILLSVIGVAILVVAVVGVSFAFFNYTRTGAANQVSTGKIKFVSEQSGSISLSNVFPLTSAQLATQTATGYTGQKDYAEVVVSIKGETTYSQGLDYRVSATGVDFTTSASGTGSTNVTLPVNVTVTATGLGSEVATLSGNTDQVKVYSYTSTTPLAEGNLLAEGHIKNTEDASTFTGQRINGTLTVRAYLDAGTLAITDTYAGSGNEATDQNGTTDSWVNGRTVITTDQWNSLASSPLSFKVKVESKETGGSYVS